MKKFEPKFVPVSQVPNCQRISTGCLAIDEITFGGISMNGITEIYGCSGVGKTQFCLQLSVRVQLTAQNVSATTSSSHKGVVYICTEDVFPSKRLNQIALQLRHDTNCNLNFDDMIFLKHSTDFEQLMNCITFEVPKLIQTKDIALIIIDSITGVFRSDNLDVNYKHRLRNIVDIASKLLQLSARYQIAVVCTNQVTDNLTTGCREPCLGLGWSNLVTRRFEIKRLPGSSVRQFQTIFAPDLPNKSCKFGISSSGLVVI